MYAAGKIPGSFFKREGRAGEKATLIARMIDRPLRPLFPKGWRRETQLVNLTLSVDQVHPYDILAMNGASAALMISDIPYPTAVGAVRIGKIEGNFVVNPTEEQLLTTDMDLVVAGTDEAVLMVECGANEVPEAEILDALDIAHSAIKKLCAAQVELQKKAGKPKQEIEVTKAAEGLIDEIAESHGDALDEATSVDGQARAPGRDEGRRGGGARAVLRARRRAPSTARSARTRSSRSTRSRRRSSASASPSTRSARTAAPSARSARSRSTSSRCRARTARRCSRAARRRRCRVVALGTTREEMRLDNLGLETSKRYFHHYNFPPFSVGEAGFMRGPKRRDIGHGALAERALVPMIPDQEKFPYTIRVVSDILESNGSSSMASVCGSSAVADGRRRAAHAAGRRHRHGPDQGGRRLRRSSPTSPASRTTSATWTSRSRAPTRASPPCRWTSRSRASRSRSCATRSSQAKEGRTFILGKMDEAIERPARAALRARPADQLDPDRPGEDRPADRQGRRDDPLAAGGVRVPDRRQRRGHGPRLRRHRRQGRRPGRAHPLDDQGGRGRRRVHAARSSRPRPSAPSSSSPRAPTACCTSPTSRRATASARSKRCSTRATRSTSASSRSTRSAAASACASPRTRTSPARPRRSWPPSAPATRRWAAAAAVTAARAAAAVTATATAAAAATAARRPRRPRA